MEIAIYQMKVQEIHFMIFKCNVDNKRKKRSLWHEKEIVVWFKSNYNLFYLFELIPPNPRPEIFSYVPRSNSYKAFTVKEAT